MTLPLGEVQLQFLTDHRHAARVTMRTDATPHLAQGGVGLVATARLAKCSA